MPRTQMNARSKVPSPAHADAIRELAGLHTILNHAAEALGFEGEEKGAHHLIDRVMKRLGQIKDEIVVPSVVFTPPKPCSEYRAEGLPSGFDTITGFIARENPEMIEFMDDLVGDTLRDLTRLGCEQVFSEQVSSVAKREQLEGALSFARKGDTIVVTKLDRLARSVIHMGEIVSRLEAKGVALRIEAMGVDTSTPTGKLMLNVLASVAQFEREMMLERQREGIAKAKGEGRYQGRKPTAMAKADQVKALAAKGMSMGQIAVEVGIGKGSVHRILAGKPAGAKGEPEAATP